MDNMADESAVTIGFQIKEIRVSSFTINESLMNVDAEIGFGILLQHLFDSEHSEQIVQVEIEAGTLPEKAPMVVLHSACHYHLTGYQDWLQSQPEEHRIPGILPSGLATALNSISISTTRGVLFERLRGTSLQGVVLPIIDPSAFQPAG
jgi:hypothetical protein